MKTIIKILFVILLAAILPVGHAYAISYNINYTINYFPPSPCNQTYIGNTLLSDTTMGGTLTLRYANPTTGDQISLPAVQIPPSPCDGSLTGGFSPPLPFDTEMLPLSLFASFDGGLVDVSLPAVQYPVYAFDPGTTSDSRVVQSDPGAPPNVYFASIDPEGYINYVGTNPGPPDLPLFVFASPGTLVGTLSIEVTPVPEPATLLLLAPGLAGIWAFRRRGAAR